MDNKTVLMTLKCIFNTLCALAQNSANYSEEVYKTLERVAENIDNLEKQLED
jgi:hypothetical protein